MSFKQETIKNKSIKLNPWNEFNRLLTENDVYYI